MTNDRGDERNPAASIDETGTIDLAALHRATGGDLELQREVVSMFTLQVTEKLETIRRSVAERDAENLQRASHTLLGSCTTLGVVGMTGFLLALERSAMSASFETAQTLCEELAVAAGQALRLLEQSVLSSR